MIFVLFVFYSKKGVFKCYFSSDGGDIWIGESSEICRVYRLMVYRVWVSVFV